MRRWRWRWRRNPYNKIRTGVFSGLSTSPSSLLYFHQQTNKASAEPHSSAYTNAQICLMNGERRKVLQKHKRYGIC